ncbi:MAG TPA: translation initiation factor IF-2 [Candidatus Binataceae bacterium]|nr:translation initiation factor IF-2 [Candidatus Binataceae bacterium]
MARKRIKTLASEWGVPVDDVLASCTRLHLPHAHSESSLLSQEETDRVKADLDDQAHRAALMRRETVLETSAGKVLEKRLNATVMRRRHAEPDPNSPPVADEPFHFEVEKDQNEQFAAPFFEEPIAGEPAEPPFFEPVETPAPPPESVSQAAHEEPIAASAQPESAPPDKPAPEPVLETAPVEASTSNGSSTPEAAGEPREAAPDSESRSMDNQGAAIAPPEETGPIANGTAHAGEPAPVLSVAGDTDNTEKPSLAASAEVTPVEPPPMPRKPAPVARHEGGLPPARQTPPSRPPFPPRPAQPPRISPPLASPMVQPPRDSTPTRTLGPTIGYRGPGSQQRRPEVRPQASTDPSKTINLTGGAHASAPSLDDGPRGPKVLGKIDLRKPTPPPRPAAPSGIARTGAGAVRPSERRVSPSQAAPGQPDFVPGLPPPDQLKPGARPIKKKRVVKKGTTDLAAEREMRGLRVPKKRRALPGKEQRKTAITTPKASKRIVRITEGVTVADLARNMGVKAGEIIRKLMDLGVMSTLNQVLDVDTATLVASEFGYSVENVAFDAESAIEESEEVAAGEVVTRPPVVTVMGHVDHGKTSLLDAIRHTSVTEGEFGGITQHIGAYTVDINDRKISFVDTPGHEAFTAMRARGAKVTDIVILVVAADEGVMPQTVEALNHAKAAKVPIIVAINKIDRPEANPDRVKQQLTEHGLIPEDYGGDTIVVPVSARTREGIDRLLEMILLQADVMDLKANPDRSARGTVVESELDKGRGPVATVLIQEGTLHQGDAFVCGTSYGRVRAMQNHLGQRITEAGPSTPVEIFGLSAVPEPGTSFVGVAEESKARQVAEFRRSKQREGVLQKTSRISLQDLSERMLAGEVKELSVIIKGDVNGSVEALAESLMRLSTSEVKLDIVHRSVGAISETDVTLASASRAIIIGFNVRPEPKAAQLAEKENVEIRLYTIIYEAINDIREAMEGLLAPTYREKSLGRAEVRQTFVVQGTTVAGVMVVEGKVLRNARARLVRDGRVVWEGKIATLRRFKDDAREVMAGYECGIGLENFNDIKPGDVIEDYELEAVLRKLAIPKPEAVRGASPAIEKQPPA